jgi:glutaredoxin
VPTPLTLTLLSKPGCHLCEDLRALLDDLQPDYGYAIDERDITADPDLFERYRYEIPVLLREGVELARGPVDERRLTAMLRECAAD